jgi:hypothetical protein
MFVFGVVYLLALMPRAWTFGQLQGDLQSLSIMLVPHHVAVLAKITAPNYI